MMSARHSCSIVTEKLFKLWSILADTAQLFCDNENRSYDVVTSLWGWNENITFNTQTEIKSSIKNTAAAANKQIWMNPNDNGGDRYL